MIGFVYAIRSGDRVKIGWSRNPRLRMTKLRSDNSAPCELLGAVPASLEQEAEAHALLSPWNVSGEWFDANARPVAEFCRLVQARTAVKVRSDRVCHTDFQALLWERGLKMKDLASALGVGKANISKWARGKVPAEKVLLVEKVTSISRHDLRPDIYGPAKREGAAA